MAKNRMTVDFSGVDSYIQRLQKLPGAAEKAITAALKETQDFIADKAAASMTPQTRREPLRARFSAMGRLCGQWIPRQLR